MIELLLALLLQITVITGDTADKKDRDKNTTTTSPQPTKDSNPTEGTKLPGVGSKGFGGSGNWDTRN